MGLGYINVYKEHILYPKGKKDHIVLTMQNLFCLQQMSRATIMHPLAWNFLQKGLMQQNGNPEARFYLFYRFFHASAHEGVLDNPD